MANGLTFKDFKFGKTEIHIRGEHKLSYSDISQKSINEIKKEFKLFMLRIFKIRVRFLGKRKYAKIVS